MRSTCLLLSIGLLMAACTDATTSKESMLSTLPARAKGYDLAGPVDMVQDAQVEQILRVEAHRTATLPYVVVASYNNEDFSKRVSVHLRAGYVLRGPMRTERDRYHGGFAYIQNMVLPDSSGKLSVEQWKKLAK